MVPPPTCLIPTWTPPLCGAACSTLPCCSTSISSWQNQRYADANLGWEEVGGTAPSWSQSAFCFLTFVAALSASWFSSDAECWFSGMDKKNLPLVLMLKKGEAGLGSMWEGVQCFLVHSHEYFSSKVSIYLGIHFFCHALFYFLSA